MEVACGVKPKIMEDRASKASADPVKDMIPDVVEELTRDGDGKIVTSKYLRGKLLGKGGFAKCFQASLLPCQTQYALKIVSKSTLAKSRAKQKLQTEIQIHRKMKHLYVVRFERYFEDVHNAYILLELCANNSMSELLKRRRRVAEVEVRCYISQLVIAIKYMHGQLVIHRDLKLGNLFLDSELRVKVGDFGLAARLSHATEKRRTICGTPNYIAPEILEGKDGHSYEVDIWSAGVVMYTLLIGTPPFESKDVKSTYKRILCNNYSFPDHIHVSDDAKSLIRLILQNRPENRPSLDTILNHSFFTRSSNSIPVRLPESALFCTPQKHQLSYTKAVSESVYETTGYGDENDPTMINRIRNSSNNPNNNNTQKPHAIGGAVDKAKSDKRSSLTGVLANMKSIKDYFTTGHENNHPNQGNGGHHGVPALALGNCDNDKVVRTSGTMFPAINSGRDSRENSLAPMRLSQDHATGGFLSARSTVSSVVPPPPVVNNATTAGTTRVNTRSQNKFEIFQDNNNKATARPASATSHHQSMPALVTKPTLSKSPFRTTKSKQTDSGVKKRGSSSLSSTAAAVSNSTPGALGAHIHQIETELQNVHLDAPASRLATRSQSAVLSATKTNRVNGTEKTPTRPGSARNYNRRGTVHTPNATGGADTAMSGKKVKRKSSDSEVSPAASTALGGASQFNNNNTAAALTTPAVDHAQRKKYSRTPGTLEAMHDMLVLSCPDNLDGGDEGMNNSYMLTERGNAAPSTTSSYPIQSSSSAAVNNNYLSSQAAHVWVVRYVDYTSKYGLGFLLNTGSVGVYFNDSTKIILSANGEIFQYFERKRQNETVNSARGEVFEQITQTHSIHLYPLELQKKVTLLIHFRNYLTDESTCNNNGKSGNDGGNNTDRGMEEIMKIRLPVDSNTANAASASIKYGTNSAVYIPSKHSVVTSSSLKSIHDQNNVLNTSVESPASSSQRGTAGMNGSDSSNNGEMIYLKKWVRTRHAILFRLSNRTVQVVFFDRSEVLLSSEARVITYVNKQGERSDHSLTDVLQTGRRDIAKRLKYTKDIMYRLITIQQPK